MMLRSFEMDARDSGFVQGKSLGLAEGIEQGRSEGIEQGSRQAKFETARLMMQHNYPVSEISLMTGLSKEEIETMQ